VNGLQQQAAEEWQQVPAEQPVKNFRARGELVSQAQNAPLGFLRGGFPSWTFVAFVVKVFRITDNGSDPKFLAHCNLLLSVRRRITFVLTF